MPKASLASAPFAFSNFASDSLPAFPVTTCRATPRLQLVHLRGCALSFPDSPQPSPPPPTDLAACPETRSEASLAFTRQPSLLHSPPRPLHREHTRRLCVYHSLLRLLTCNNTSKVSAFPLCAAPASAPLRAKSTLSNQSPSTPRSVLCPPVLHRTTTTSPSACHLRPSYAIELPLTIVPDFRSAFRDGAPLLPFTP